MRYFQHVLNPGRIESVRHPIDLEVYAADPIWEEVTVTPLNSLCPDSDVIERAARAMADDWNPDRDPILTAMFRDYANTLATAGLLAPSDTFASAKSGEEAIQRLARAAFMVDGTHHFWVDELGRPVCLCGFIGNARKRTRTSLRLGV